MGTRHWILFYVWMAPASCCLFCCGPFPFSTPPVDSDNMPGLWLVNRFAHFSTMARCLAGRQTKGSLQKAIGWPLDWSILWASCQDIWSKRHVWQCLGNHTITALGAASTSAAASTPNLPFAPPGCQPFELTRTLRKCSPSNIWSCDPRIEMHNLTIWQVWKSYLLQRRKIWQAPAINLATVCHTALHLKRTKQRQSVFLVSRWRCQNLATHLLQSQTSAKTTRTFPDDLPAALGGAQLTFSAANRPLRPLWKPQTRNVSSQTSQQPKFEVHEESSLWCPEPSSSESTTSMQCCWPQGRISFRDV